MKRIFSNGTIYVIMLIILVGFISNIANYLDKRNEIKQNEINNMIVTDNQIEAAMDITLSNLDSLSQVHYFDYTARNILLKDNQQADERTRFYNSTYMDNAISHIVAMNPVIIRASLITGNGNVYSNYTSVLSDYVNFIKAEKQDNIPQGFTGTYYTEQYDYVISQNKVRLITAIHPLYAYLNREIATLCVDIDYDALVRLLKEDVISQDGCYFIFDKERPLVQIYEGAYEELFQKDSQSKQKLMEQIIAEDDQELYSKITLDGKPGYITKRVNQITGWTQVHFRSEDLMLHEVNKKNQQNMLLLTGVFCATLLLFGGFTKMITKPLEYFEKAINQHSGSELKPIVYDSRLIGRNIRSVMDSYNNLVDRVNNYIDREIIYEKNQRHTQAIALRYQINPHFLFNSLNIIASMAELNDSPEIIDMTRHLSVIMQYNVRGTKFVTLKEEIDIVTAYLKIQNVRFGNKVDIQYDIQQELLKVRIIKFILQPLLENVFSHAYPPNAKAIMEVKICAHREDDFLVLQVKDNGAGIRLEVLEQLNYELEHEIDSQTILNEDEWTESIGLKNVNARIKNYYGNDCFIKLLNQNGKGVVVSIRLKIDSL